MTTKMELHEIYSNSAEELYSRLIPSMKEICDQFTTDGPKLPQIFKFVVAAVEEKVAYMSQEGEEG